MRLIAVLIAAIVTIGLVYLTFVQGVSEVAGFEVERAADGASWTWARSGHGDWHFLWLDVPPHGEHGPAS